MSEMFSHIPQAILPYYRQLSVAVLLSGLFQFCCLLLRHRFHLCDVASHFALFAFCVLCFFAVVGLGLKLRWQTICHAALAGLCLMYVSEYFSRVEYTKSPSGPVCTIMSYNVHTQNDNRDEILKYVRQISPDVVLFMEVDTRWKKALSSLNDLYPHSQMYSQPDNFGMAIFSKLPMDVETKFSTDWQVPMFDATIYLGDDQLRLIGLHTLPPLRDSYWTRSRKQVEVVLRMVRPGEKTVLVGDINSTPNGILYREIVNSGKLKPTGWKRCLSPTWGPPMASLLQLDHVFVSEGVQVLHDSLGPRHGSDHRPVMTTVSLENNESS